MNSFLLKIFTSQNSVEDFKNKSLIELDATTKESEVLVKGNITEIL
jgi:hypothetical protein